MVTLSERTYDAQNLENPAISSLAKDVIAINDALVGGGTPVDPTLYATKTGLYKDATTPVDLETTCQSFETAINERVTNTELTTALDTSAAFVALDPSSNTSIPLDAALANIYVAPATISEQDMDTMVKKLATEIVNNTNNLKVIVKAVTDSITQQKTTT